jgi:uncharacterized integral membrane protein
MSRLFGIVTALAVVLLSMGFAVLNAGNDVTLNLGLFTLYRAPVALVAFGGLFVGMVVMFATGIHTDLKVRRVLRERLAEESREEQRWIDRNQRDLFEAQPSPEAAGSAESEGEGSAPSPAASLEPEPREPPTPAVEATELEPLKLPSPAVEATEPDLQGEGS